jgi:predicted Zn-dependent protease
MRENPPIESAPPELSRHGVPLPCHEARRPMPFVLALIALACLSHLSCATTDIKPLTEHGCNYGVQKDERSLIERSDRFEKELHKKGLVVNDPDLQRYIDEVGSKLVPPQASEHVRFHFLVLRDPTINAFALIQGTVCINSGMIARLENEAQLAHVLAHEITHTVNRHQLKFLRSAQNKTVRAKVAEMALVPPAAAFGGGGVAAMLIELTHAATISGYGRELEEEADKQALLMIAAAGYDIHQTPKLFSALNEIEDPGGLAGFLYSNHPSNRAREKYTRELVDSGEIPEPSKGIVNADKYRKNVHKIAIQNIRLRLKAGHYQFALNEAKAMIRKHGDEAWLHYLAGEAHRRMAEDPKGAAREAAMRRRERPGRSLFTEYEWRVDKELAEADEEFQHALELDPSFVRAHRGIGLVAYQRGNDETARQELSAYLNGDSRVFDRRYIERILGKVSR